jgi:hypothetical protein
MKRKLTFGILFLAVLAAAATARAKADGWPQPPLPPHAEIGFHH